MTIIKILSIGITLILVAWSFVALKALPDKPEIPRISPEQGLKVLAWVIGIVSIISLSLSSTNEHYSIPILDSLAPELAGISFTILVIDWFNEQREKRQIIRQLASHSNEFALDAVSIVREKGWLSDGSLHGANLAHANLKSADFSKADLRNANFQGANLEHTLFTCEESEYWLNPQLETMFLDNHELFGANLEGANLNRAILNDAILAKANLMYTNLEYAYLINADLRKVNLRSARLWGAKIWNVDLRGADLSGADLDWTIFVNVTYDEHTQWPEGYKLDPERMRYIGQALG